LTIKVQVAERQARDIYKRAAEVVCRSKIILGVGLSKHLYRHSRPSERSFKLKIGISEIG